MCREVCVILRCEKMEFFFTFLSFSTKFKAKTNTEQQESVASIRDKVCCNFPSQRVNDYVFKVI